MILRGHKFKHYFQNVLDPFCNCRLGLETTAHVSLHCYNFMHQRETTLDNLSQVVHDILKLNENLQIDTLLFGDPKCSVSINSEILLTSISYILLPKRFDGSLI